jgi:predicted RNA-binding Zn-ribbon protein involved in translation (DUF1610 family)
MYTPAMTAALTALSDNRNVRGVIKCPNCGEQALLLFAARNNDTDMVAACPECKVVSSLTHPKETE